MRFATSLVVLVALVALAGCGDDDVGAGVDAGPPPVDAGLPLTDAGSDAPRERAPLFRNSIPLDNFTLARQALRILGAPEAGATTVYCNECHMLTQATIRAWSVQTNTAMGGCLTDLLVSTDARAAEMIACTQLPPGTYAPSRLGIVSTAADLDWFRYVFRHGVTGDWEAEHARFLAEAGMPRGMHPRLTQDEFDIVMEWFRRDIPEIDTVLPGGPGPGTCMPLVGPEVATHVTAMSTTGWRAANRSTGILMYGCAGATTPSDCLATEMRASATTFGAQWDVVPGTAHRVLFTTDFGSSFWTRSSADGRFVGQGGGSTAGFGSTIVDLQRDVQIGANANYDPAFFPDNSGFVFHGAGALFCEQNVLTTGTPTTITFGEAGCGSVSGVGLYEHVGTALGGGDYWAVSGSFTSDDGGHGRTTDDPSAGFSMTERLTLTAMINDGTRFRASGTTSIMTPSEGDTVISPSSRLLVSRAAASDGSQDGFVLRGLTASRGGTVVSATAPVIGRYCINGGKPGISYDERWMVLHHYLDDGDAMDLGFTGPGDPGWAPYRSSGAANIYLVDFLDGSVTRITNMQPGQYALFPHFRSDGWIYFIVRGAGSGEHIVASDAALELE